MKTAITIQESSELIQLESVIERNKESFLKACQSLSEINAKRLYRADYATFQEYCAERWGFSRQRGYQMIAFAKMSTTVDTLPENEWQSRKTPSPSPAPTTPEVAQNVIPPPTVMQDSPPAGVEPSGAQQEAEEVSLPEPEPTKRTADAEFLEALGADNAEEIRRASYLEILRRVDSLAELVDDTDLDSDQWANIYGPLFHKVLPLVERKRKAALIAEQTSN